MKPLLPLGGIPAAIALLSALPTNAPAAIFAQAPFTGDADNGIDPSKAYTHAINYDFTGNVTVNGAVFTGTGAGVAAPSSSNFSLTGTGSAFGAANNPPVTGDSFNLVNDFVYNGNPAVLTLDNLRVGERYRTTFYNTSFGSPGGRVNTITTSQGDSIVFDQNFTNGKNGNLLTYEFIASGNSITFNIDPATTDTFHHYAVSNERLDYQALFTDNFFGPGNPNTQDVNFNAAARQGGSLVADNGGPINYAKSGNIQVGNPTGGLDSGNYLLSGGGAASPDVNFNSTLSQNGLLVSFDAATQINSPSGSGWAGFVLGSDEANRLGFMNGAFDHFGILFRGNGLIEAWDGNTRVSPASPNEILWGPSGEGNLFHHFDIELTDPTDLNPFDGVGQTDIAVFADGIEIFQFSKLGGGYANNFMNFHVSGVAGFDNLVIAQAIPEPSRAIFLALGLAAAALRRRR